MSWWLVNRPILQIPFHKALKQMPLLRKVGRRATSRSGGLSPAHPTHIFSGEETRWMSGESGEGGTAAFKGSRFSGTRQSPKAMKTIGSPDVGSKLFNLSRVNRRVAQGWPLVWGGCYVFRLSHKLPLWCGTCKMRSLPVHGSFC